MVNSTETAARECVYCRERIAPGSDSAVVAGFGAGHKPSSWYCGQVCRRRHLRDERRQPSCPVCTRRFIPTSKNPVGRPQIYCSSKCQSERERQIGRATKALARGVLPDRLADVKAALADAMMLQSFWAGEWGVRPTVAPAPRARAALVARLDELHARKRVEVMAEHRAYLDEQRDREAELRRKAQAAADALDNQWRAELVKGLG